MAQDPTPRYTADDQLDFCNEWAAECPRGEGLLDWLQKERPHLLRAYDAEFLVRAAEAARAGHAVSR